MSSDSHSGADPRATTTLWAVVCACALSGMGAVAAGMGLAPGIKGRFLVADRATELGGVLVESRSRLDQVDTLREVEPLVASVAGYVPTRSWRQVLLRDHVLVGLAGDFLARVETNLDASMLPSTGSFQPWLGVGTGVRVRWDEELATRLAEPGADLSVDSLFVRKLVGEVLSVAQRLAAVHPHLTAALTGAGSGELDDLDRINEVMAEALSLHDERMVALGLEP